MHSDLKEFNQEAPEIVMPEGTLEEYVEEEEKPKKKKK